MSGKLFSRFGRRCRFRTIFRDSCTASLDEVPVQPTGVPGSARICASCRLLFFVVVSQRRNLLRKTRICFRKLLGFIGSRQQTLLGLEVIALAQKWSPSL